MQNYRRVFGFLLIATFVICVYFTTLPRTLGIENKVRSPPTCGHLPPESEILTDNISWQVFEMPEGFMKLMNAYLDERQNKTIVRINAIGIMLNITTHKMFCQFWFNGSDQPYIVKASDYILMWTLQWGGSAKQQLPYLITCPIDEKFKGHLPVSVSLTSDPCGEATNNLRILDIHPVDGIKKRFGVCTKHIYYEDRYFAIRFIEWVHMMNLLGAEKIHVYNNYVHPDFYHVLEYLEQKDLVEFIPFLQPQGITNVEVQSYFIEMNIINDCFYRTRHLYDFVVLLDPDEVIMPVRQSDMSWHDLMKNYENDSVIHDSYTAENVYYPEVNSKKVEGIPSYMYMLQHIQRSVNFSWPGNAVKSIYSPQNIVVVHNHKPLICFKGLWTCDYFGFPKEISQMSHYRNHMDSDYFNITLEDTIIWKFKEKLVAAVNETLTAINFEP